MTDILREDRGRVRVLSLNRPPSNSLTLSLLDAVFSEVTAAAADPGVRCVVLASTSPKYFSSGLDLDEMLALPAAGRITFFEKMIRTHRLLASCGKPTVAAIEGTAFLGGFILALGCDWRLMCEPTGRVALSEVRLGLSPTSALVRLVMGLTGRPGLVKDLVLRGATLRAPEAYEAGIVDRLLPAEGFKEEAVREAERLAKLAPAAYASIQRSVRVALMGDEDALWDSALREFVAILAGAEAQEGMLAMKEKRKPRWE